MTDEYTAQELRDYVEAVVWDGYNYEENASIWFEAPTSLTKFIQNSKGDGRDIVAFLDDLISRKARVPEPPAEWEKISEDKDNPTFAALKIDWYTQPVSRVMYRDNYIVHSLNGVTGHWTQLCDLNEVESVTVLDVPLEQVML